MTEPQTYANHRRIDPFFHRVLVPAATLGLGLAVAQLRRKPDLAGWWMMLSSVLLVLTILLVRLYALKVQDRLIRLEERLRMERLLPEPLRARVGELRPGQFVAMRFASDEELPALVQQVLDEGLKGDDIKRRIRTWRPDEFRV